MRETFATVVLAGGEGRRIGGAKPLLQLGGETLIARALGTARTWSDCVAVAVRKTTQTGDIDAVLIVDDPRIEGPIAGLASALHFADAGRVNFLLTLPCDAPFLPADLPTRLSDGIGGANAAVAMSAGEIHPVCALWRVGVVDRLDAYLASAQRSLRGFAAEVGFVSIEWGTQPLDPFFNINDEGDLRRAEDVLRA
jgi:molybdopterin-guanine dinucleotide biosynthesis protein A